MNWLSIAIFMAVFVGVALIPPRYDPAIRLKERLRTGSWRWPYDPL